MANTTTSKQQNTTLEQAKAQVRKLILESEDIEALRTSPLLDDDTKNLLNELLIETLYEKARNDFYTFVRLMAPEIMPEGFTDGTHIRLICKELMDLEKGVNKKLMIFLSPGSMKSWLGSKLFPAWCFGRHATWNVLSIGHSTQFAEDNFGRPTKELIESQTYRKIFPGTTVKGDVKAAGRWDTDQGGKYFCTGAGAKIAGRRAHLAVMDDVVDEQSAESEIMRNKINEWYGPGLRTRLLPQGRELIIMTRWSDEDLAGYLLKGTKAKKQLKQWRVISIPAILDKESAELLNKPVGGSYWPEFWPLERLMELKEDPSMSTTKWNALYMQNPVPAEGNLVKLDWCKLWTDAERERQQIPRGMSPNLEYIVISLDTAFSEKDAADYSAYTVWGVFNRTVESFTGKYMKIPSLFLLAADKGRWSFPDLCKKVQGIYDFYKPDGIIIEKKASGQSLIQEMRRRGLPIIEFSPDTDKLTRVYACTPLFENGRIWFPDEDWALDVISDLIKFPNVVKKDIVDTCSQAILWMRDTWHVNSTEDEPEDEDDKFRLRKRTYWGALVKA